jgi:DNA polymerase-3 subunit beta
LSFKIKEENKIEITSDNGNYVMVGQNGEEYPKTPSVDDKNSVTLPCQVLNEAITKTIFATGNDDLRPVMSGVYFDFSEDSVTFVATDAHKLVRYRRKDAGFLVFTSEVCQQDINLHRHELKTKEAFVFSYKRYAIILEKQKKYKEAVELVKEAMSLKLSDRTVGEYAKRLERIQAKMAG